MTLQWFLSGKVRGATDMHKQVRRILNEQRDILSPQAVQNVAASIAEMKGLLADTVTPEALTAGVAKLEKTANTWLKTYSNASVRENVKELLVAVVVILGFSTFFLQLTKIPTGSMQPTLYGIHHEDLHRREFEIPNPITRFFQYWIYGISYIHIVAKNDGEIRMVEQPRTLLPFIKKQRFLVGDDLPENWYTVWFPPDKFEERAGFSRGQSFRKGDDIVKLKIENGDHLLVDRFTYNFRHPRRGEIIVFKTKGIIYDNLPQDQLYIKRLVALGGERVRIGGDRHLIINERRLDASTRHFEYLYHFDKTPAPDNYVGHVNGATAAKLGYPGPESLFPDETTEHLVKDKYYMAMGDNALNSLDSRYWGDLSEGNVIGKCFFVYWPITSRFGWGYR